MVSSLKGGRAVEIIGGCCRPPYASVSGVYHPTSQYTQTIRASLLTWTAILKNQCSGSWLRGPRLKYKSSSPVSNILLRTYFCGGVGFDCQPSAFIDERKRSIISFRDISTPRFSSYLFESQRPPRPRRSSQSVFLYSGISYFQNWGPIDAGFGTDSF